MKLHKIVVASIVVFALWLAFPYTLLMADECRALGICLIDSDNTRRNDERKCTRERDTSGIWGTISCYPEAMADWWACKQLHCARHLAPLCYHRFRC